MFDNFKKLIDNILNENVDDNLIKQAIAEHNEIIINYSGDDNTHTGKRLIQVYAYGLTKAGFPCIRAYEPYGDTKSRIPHWKMFRLDRILKWTPTERKFIEPPKQQGWDAEEFNKNNAVILGVSRDTIASHNKFIAKYSSQEGRLLSVLTNGVHLHTISAETSDDIEAIISELKAKNFIVSD